MARRSMAMSTTRRALLTVLMAVAFVAVLAFVFWAVDPCAQGPA
jgi:cbb3-type cytochrome oxidase subunit 3